MRESFERRVERRVDGPWMRLRGVLRTQLVPASKIETRTAYLLVLAIALGGFFILKGTTNEIKDSRRRGVLTSCNEANARHAEAIPQLVALIRNGEATAPRGQREAQEEAITALVGGRSKGVNGPREPGPAPRTKAGRLALAQTNAFIQIIAPAYKCAQRLRLFTLP